MEESQEAVTPEVVRVLVDHRQDFLRFLERRLGHRDLAEDVLQDAFAKGIDRIDTLKSDEAVIGWFYRSLRNAVADHFRRRGAADRGLERFGQELQTVDTEGELHKTVCRCVSRLASTLRPEYKEALEWVEIEGRPVKDYAASKGLTANNAGVRIFRAREALRKRVEESCGACATHGCLDCACGAPQSS